MVRRTAIVLIDVENQTDLSFEALRILLENRFYLIGQLAFADYSRPSLRWVVSHLPGNGVTQIDVDTSLSRASRPRNTMAGGNGTGSLRNGVDQVMAKILDRFAQCDYVAAIVVVSGDNYFVPNVRRAQRRGKYVIVMANPARTGKRLRRTANEFIPLPLLVAPHRRWASKGRANTSDDKSSPKSPFPAA